MNFISINSLKTELCDLIVKYYPQIHLRILFLNYNSAAGFFNYKNLIPDLMYRTVILCINIRVRSAARPMMAKVPDTCTHVLLNMEVCLLALVYC